MTKRIRATPANDPLYRRIDAMAMSQADRERAKASLRNAEVIADFVVAIGSAIRRFGAALVRRARPHSVPVNRAIRRGGQARRATA